jgi:hypothetical protein
MEKGGLTIYRSCTPVVDAQYSSESDQSPAEVIVDALAEAAGVDPLELPPLYDFVDYDTLNRLFQKHDRATDTDAILSFRIEDWNVFIRTDGRVRICDNTRPTDPEPVFESIPA